VKVATKIMEFWWMFFCLFLLVAGLWIGGAVLLELYNWGFHGVLEYKFWVFIGEEMLLIASVYVVLVCASIKLMSR
jgi:hypothetical protein